MAYQVEAWPGFIAVVRNLRDRDTSSIAFSMCDEQISRLTDPDLMDVDNTRSATSESTRETLLSLTLNCMQAALNPSEQRDSQLFSERQ